MIRTLSCMMFALLLPATLLAQPVMEARFEVSAEIEPGFLVAVEGELVCDSGEPRRSKFSLQDGQRKQLPLRSMEEAKTLCRVRALLPAGYSASYQVTRESDGGVDDLGCRFSGVRAGQALGCRISVGQDPVNLTVYLKWIGGEDEAKDVKVSLECENGERFDPKFVNQSNPVSWEISNIHPDGILCNVSQKVRDTFRPDIIDCQGLYVLPGKGEECLLINTRIVKRIEMFNRYGKVIMILLVLGVGLVAVRKFA